MNVLLGADSLALHRSGIGRMTLEIARAARIAPEVDAMMLLVNGRVRDPSMLDAMPDDAPAAVPPAGLVRRIGAMPAARMARTWLVRRGVERAAMQLRAANGQPVVYHEPNMIAKPFRGPTVVTCNDLSWLHHPEVHPADRIDWIKRRLPDTLRQATRFVAISRFTADGMVAALGIPADAIDVVPLAPSPVFQPIGPAAAAPVLARLGLRDRGYILSVSTLEPRKNFDGLLRAWLLLPAHGRPPLVIAGGRGWGSVLAGERVRNLQAEGALRLLGPVPDADLAVLYARCTLFAYPSLYEGFGLPILEAMAAGAAVVTARTTACGETAGPAALTIDPEDAPALAEAMQSIIAGEALAARLRSFGPAHAGQFTWGGTVRRLARSWARALDPAMSRTAA